MSCIAGHPDVSAAGDEVRVDPLFTRGLSTFYVGNEDWAERCRGYRAAFDALTLRDSGASIQAHGMKVAVATPDLAIDLANCVREHFPDLRVILVHREDLVAQFASLHRAQATGVWHSWQCSGETDARFELPRTAFVEHAKELRRIVMQLQTLRDSHPFHELIYERSVATGQWSGLFEFLGLSAQEPSWLAMQKVAPPAREYVANYDELQKVLAELPAPRPEDEDAAARARAENRLRQEPPAMLLDRAKAALAAGDFGEAEQLAFIALARVGDLPPSQRRKGFEVLETAWLGLGSAKRAIDGLRQLAPAYADDAHFTLLAGVVRCHAGQRDAGLADLERALQLDPGLDRARRLLDEWPGPGR